MKGFVVLLIVGFLFVGMSGLYPSVKSEDALGNTLYVGGSGTGNYSSIQGAIGNASEGDTVFVYSGAYYENIVVNKSVSIIGENKETTIVDGGLKSGLGIGFELIADRINVTGFTIQNNILNIDSNENFRSGYGMYLYSNNSKIFGNIITKNTYGITVFGSSNNLINNNIISSIVSYQSSNNIIENNEITADDQYFVEYASNEGISMFGNNNNVITNNTISNYSGVGISLSYSCENNTIYYNNFINNSQNANDSGNNFWDNGQHGNYWDNYSGLDKNNDGLGDTPYSIPGGNNQDSYPLMMPYDGTFSLKEFYVDLASVFTMLIIGMVLAIIFLLPIAYIWYKKGWRY